MAKYTFRWTCGYLNSNYFDVIGDGERYEIELRRSVSDYERSIFNGTESEWQRDIVPLVGCIHRGGGYPIPAEVVSAFNEWRMEEHLAHRRQIDANPDRYGVVDWKNDAMFRAPVPVRSARSVTDPIPGKRPGYDFPSSVWHGWILDGENTLAHLKAA